MRLARSIFLRALPVAAIFLANACLVLPTVAAPNEDEVLDFSIYTQPQRLIEVAPGRKLNLVCVGEGSPTVILDIGVGDPAGDWARVQARIGKSHRTCSYDRAGIGFSDASTGGGSSAEIVADLRSLLSAASIKPPYLLVGQSYGGMNVRLYYYLHPEEVVGLVLVEPAHEDQDEGFRMLSPKALSRAAWVAFREPGRKDRERCIKAAEDGAEPTSLAFKDCVVAPPALLPDAIKPMYLAMQSTAKFQRAQGTEETAVYAASVEQLRNNRRGFGSLPVIVLSRSAEVRPLREWETARLRETRYRFWLNLHQGLADSSSRGEHRVIENSDHLLQLSQPAAVVSAIHDVISLVSNKESSVAN
ncbi:MAG: alpha/beta fold hydrolase [Arenimonas sp.]